MPEYIKPVAGNLGTNKFGPLHTGQDIPVPVGTPVYASAPGTVTMAGLDGPRGNTIEIDHGNGHKTVYAHLSGFQVSKGAKIVEQGQLIGLSGGARGAVGAGTSTGPHLHAGHKINGVPVDPVPYWGGDFDAAPNDRENSLGGMKKATPFGEVDLSKPGASLLDIATNGQNWMRIGIFIAGFVLVLIVVVKFLSNTEAGKAAVDGVKSTAGVAKKVAAVAVTKNPAAAAV